MNKIRLEIELLDQQPDPSNYDEDEFEEDQPAAELAY